jgi:transcriptional regulator GlxA family with amidase domain
VAVEHAVREGQPYVDASADPDTLGRATAFIEAHPELHIVLADIARAAHVTPRAVQLTFRRRLDTTPIAYLRQVRLRHARQELEDFGPDDGVTVTRIAIDWGFLNSARFATYYRTAYGENPSVTLARSATARPTCRGPALPDRL